MQRPPNEMRVVKAANLKAIAEERGMKPDVSGRKVFRVCWPRYRALREQMLHGRLRVTRQVDAPSVSSTSIYQLAEVCYLADFDKAVNAALRMAAMRDNPRNRKHQHQRRDLWAMGYVVGWPTPAVAKRIGVSERQCWNLRSVLEEIIGKALWERGFCGVAVDAKDFDPVLLYFGAKQGILQEQRDKTVRCA